MAELLLGISVGFFMYAFINHKLLNYSWLDSKYFLWTGGIILLISLYLFGV
jgi:hypothetical protein